MNSSPESEFDEWFSQTHGGSSDTEIESDVDECIFDQMNDQDLF